MNLLTEGKEKGIIKETNGLTRKLTINGHTEVYHVYKIRLDYLYFNDQNDRISTWISQYKADNKLSKLDITDKNKYNDIIHGFINESNPEAIKKTQTNIEMVDQREPGVILSDGRIIDGNRRFTCLRNLSKKNSRFNYFEAVILNENLENNAKEIKMLELMIQHGEESRVDYNPIDKLVGIYNDLVENRLLTPKEYADSTNDSINKINEEIEISKLLVEFLEFINAPKQYYLAREMDLNGPLRELYRILKKVKDEDKKEDTKIAAFVNFLMEPVGDMTRFIRKVKPITESNYLDNYLEEQMVIAEEVLEDLPPVGEMNKKIINEVFRSNDRLKESLESSLRKAETKVKSKESRNRPLKILTEVGDKLEGIDINIFKKLSEEELAEIICKVDSIQGLLEGIRTGANV